jgi:hypothetical protein
MYVYMYVYVYYMSKYIHNTVFTGACAIVTENSILNGKGAGVVRRHLSDLKNNNKTKKSCLCTT